MIPYKSFILGKQSQINLKIIQYSEMYFINKENFEEINKQESQLSNLINELTINTMYKIINHKYERDCYDNKRLYELVLKRMPYLKNVSDTELAEYIGTTRSVINKIKNTQHKK